MVRKSAPMIKPCKLCNSAINVRCRKEATGLVVRHWLYRVYCEGCGRDVTDSSKNRAIERWNEIYGD